ncbi:MAG: hypothetical protein E7062_06845, partial [Spirochaetaceae bacterium]|nr:hypothetical protein [Spirochaetaceae bacterium]
MLIGECLKRKRRVAMSSQKQQKLLEQLQEMAKSTGLDFSEEIATITQKLESSAENSSKIWKTVELARHSDRP